MVIKRLLILFLLAFLIRIGIFYLEPIITDDGVTYVELGKNFISGKGFIDLDGNFGRLTHPLYPILVGFSTLFFKDLAFAGSFVSILFGSLLVFPVYFLARSIYNSKVGYISAFCVCWYPYLTNNSTKVLTSATYIFFFICSISLAKSLLREKPKITTYLLLGFLVGLTFLIRFEIIGYFTILILFLLLFGKRYPKRFILRTILIFMITILPFLIYVKINTSQLGLIPVDKLKSSMEGFPVDKQAKAISSISDYFFTSFPNYVRHYLLEAGKMYTRDLPNIFPPLLIFIAGFGIASRGLKCLRDEIYFAVIIMITMLGYPIIRAGARNLVYILPLLIILMSNGVFQMAQQLSNTTYFHNMRSKQFSANIIVSSILIVVMGTLLPQLLRPLIFGPDPKTPVALMQMGRWMKKNLPTQEKILSSEYFSAFYADTKATPLPNGYDAAYKRAKQEGINYIVVSNFRGFHRLQVDLMAGLEEREKAKLVHKIKAGNTWALLYKLPEQ